MHHDATSLILNLFKKYYWLLSIYKMQWYANEYIWGCNIDTRTLWSKLEMWSYHSWQDCNVLIIKWFNEYHLHQELVTEDIQYEDPLIRVEGFQEVENLSSAFRWKCYTLEIVKMKQAVSEIYLILFKFCPLQETYRICDATNWFCASQSRKGEEIGQNILLYPLLMKITTQITSTRTQ